MDIQHKRVLLTGATGGIGRAIAAEFAARGASLVLTGRRLGALKKLASELRDKAESIVIVAADLAVDADVERLISEAGQVDILVANAGLPGTDDITAYSKEEIEQHLKVNLQAPILLARAVIPGMLERGDGQLIFMSSIAGKIPSPLSSLYSASKYGLRGFADCLRMDLHGTGVGVSGIYPGMIRDAGMYANSGAKIPKGAPSNTAEDVAKAVTHAVQRDLASVDVTGVAIKASVHIAHFSPALNNFTQKLAGAKAVAREFSDGQRDNKKPTRR